MLQMEPGDDYVVLEMGASGPGEIARLAALCRPTIGVITHVGDAHLGGFGTRQGIAEAKGELLDALPADGCAVLGDDPWLKRLRDRSAARTTMVGRGMDCELIAKEVVLGQGTLSYIVRDVNFEVPVWGRHHLTAALAAVAVGLELGCTLEETAEALERFTTVPMRCEVTQVRGATIINDTYNASPASMLAALELLRDFDTRGRRIVVLGDMRELGDESGEPTSRTGRTGRQSMWCRPADRVRRVCTLCDCRSTSFGTAGQPIAGMPDTGRDTAPPGPSDSSRRRGSRERIESPGNGTNRSGYADLSTTTNGLRLKTAGRRR